MEGRKKFQKIINFSFLLLIFLSFVAYIVYKNKITDKNIPAIPEGVSYLSIFPGLTKETEMQKIMGNPLNISTNDKQKIYEYSSLSKFRNNEVITSDGTVDFIREIVTSNGKMVKDITSLYGEPEYFLYQMSELNIFNLYVYPSKGLAYVANLGGYILEIWYFTPTTIDDFVSKWGEGYSFNEPSPHLDIFSPDETRPLDDSSSTDNGPIY